jgi:hypothetical protein
MFKRLTRDAAIVSFVIVGGAFEIVLGGGRPSVFTFLTALALTPIGLRLDEAHRRNNKATGEEG